MPRIRLDKLVVARKLAEDLEEAKAVIENGKILVNGALAQSVNSFVDSGCALNFVKEKPKFVSRGGLKLEHALLEFNINVHGKNCLDIGASTGGFTDVLLQNGASSVVAVDVGHGQLDLKIRNDDRVNVFEKTNAKNITKELVGLADLAVIDVSFTSLVPIINPVSKCLKETIILALIKPQFEVDQKYLDKNGVVNDANARHDCIKNIANLLQPDFMIAKLIKSPITGIKGNVEYLCLITKFQQGEIGIDLDRLEDLIGE